MSGTVAALAVAGCDGLGIFAACVGCLWVLGALERLRRRQAFRSRKPRPVAVSGWRLAVSALFGLAWMAVWVTAMLACELAKAAGRAARSATRKLRRALNVRLRRPRWSDAELAVLDNAEGLQWLLGGLPAARRERRLP
jgi:hypothetical protein